MNYIFLDIDGVMNNRSDWISKVDNNTEQFRSHRMFCDTAWQMLSDVVKETGAKIILSSSWRTSLIQEGETIKPKRFREASVSKLLEYFSNYNIPLVGLTTGRYDYRGKQIIEYVNSHFTLEDKWIVLDDEVCDIRGYVAENQIIDTDFETGLLPEHCEKIIQYFKGE